MYIGSKIVCGVVVRDENVIELKASRDTGIVEWFDETSGLFELGGLEIKSPIEANNIKNVLLTTLEDGTFGEGYIGIILAEAGQYLLTEETAQLIPYGETKAVASYAIDWNIISDSDEQDENDEY